MILQQEMDMRKAPAARHVYQALAEGVLEVLPQMQVSRLPGCLPGEVLLPRSHTARREAEAAYPELSWEALVLLPVPHRLKRKSD